MPRKDERHARGSSPRGETRVEQSQISGQNVGIGSARDIHIHQSSQATDERRRESDWDEDEEFRLEPGDWRIFELDLKIGQSLTGLVKSDREVSCYVLGPNSLQSFEDGENFNPYWESEDVTRTKVSYEPESGHKFYFVVYRDEEEDEDASVSVKLRVEK